MRASRVGVRLNGRSCFFERQISKQMHHVGSKTRRRGVTSKHCCMEYSQKPYVVVHCVIVSSARRSEDLLIWCGENSVKSCSARH